MTRPHQELHQVHMPVTYPRIYLDLAQERGIDPAHVLQKAGLEPALFADPVGKITLQQHFQLITAVIELTGDPGLGIELGCRSPVTIHGNLGYALLCCNTLGEAVDLLLRFWQLRGKGIELSYIQQGEWNIFDFYSVVRLPERLHRVAFDFILTSVYRGFQFLVGNMDTPGEIWFDYPEPDYIHRFRDRLPSVHYEMPLLQIRIPGRNLMNRRLPMSDPEALSLAVAQCEREYALLGTAQDDTLARARTLMTPGADGYPTPQQLAARLHMSPRTFRRRLQMQGSGYKRMLEEARRRDAIAFLENPELDIQTIAELLGYADPANFTRAFRLWTGRSPREYRTLYYSLRSGRSRTESQEAKP